MQMLEQDNRFALKTFVTGMHLAPEFGQTISAILADGFGVSERIETILASDTPQGVAKAIGLGVIGFAQAFDRDPPDILLVLGDRFESWAAAIAALPFSIPIGHIHGGEVTVGAMDDSIRHSLTKLSHLHFVAAEEYARRIVQLGEDPWRVTVCGAPGLDTVVGTALLDRSELAIELGFYVPPESLLVTFHPVSTDWGGTARRTRALLDALSQSGRPVIFTAPNADAGGRQIRALLDEYTAAHPTARMLINAGSRIYFSLMACVSAMVGNSSSGIIEAPTFSLPVVDIGERQMGRLRAANVVHCSEDVSSIAAAIRRATSPDFRTSLTGLVNPYGDGHASERIIERLASLDSGPELTTKRFRDLTSQGGASGGEPLRGLK